MTFKIECDYIDNYDLPVEIQGDGTGTVGVAIDGYYGAWVTVENGKIVSFRLISYGMDVEIPATTEAHRKIQEALREE